MLREMELPEIPEAVTHGFEILAIFEIFEILAIPC
jgi:hypothetical protein